MNFLKTKSDRVFVFIGYIFILLFAAFIHRSDTLPGYDYLFTATWVYWGLFFMQIATRWVVTQFVKKDVK